MESFAGENYPQISAGYQAVFVISLRLFSKKKMIVSFEGPPAAGKSTLADELGSLPHVYVVPEVNLLFKRPDPEPDEWYLDRQVCRWEIAAKMAESNSLVILDGDPFQPLWFNWIYSDEKWTSTAQCYAFYQRMIRDGRVRFPDQYLFFILSAEERQKREISRGKARGHDKQRSIRKYERYAKLVLPQKRYFEALQNEFTERVRIFESDTASDGRFLLELKAINKPRCDLREELRILDFMVEWIQSNEGEQVASHNSGQRSAPTSA